jgi:hypothetical protein
MTLILSHDLTMFEGVSQFSAKPATIELYEDRLVVTKRDDAPEIVIDTPLSELKVGGSGAMLTFTVGEFKRRVDFSFAARAAMIAPGGIFTAGALIKQSGINAWLSEFKARGVKVSYITMGQIWLWALGATALIVAVVAVYGINSVS